MADSAHFHVPPGVCQLASRRVSFRKTVTDASLPEDYLEALEQKRRQLDESIHKYIASKEREYKNYEKELRAQHKIPESAIGASISTSPELRSQGDATNSRQRQSLKRHDDNTPSKRRTSSESTTLSMGDASVAGTSSEIRSVSAAQALLMHGARLRRESNAIEDEPLMTEAKATIAGLTDRRASIERDKDFAGLFMPTFLAAIDDKTLRNSLERTSSAPAAQKASAADKSLEQTEPTDPPRALSDTAVDAVESAKSKRPTQLLVKSRTSSSGSSADGRLASALKSPTQKERPKGKRVSLAVGDSIVAPSDHVPQSESATGHAPSHSRVRASGIERERGQAIHPSPLSQAVAVSASPITGPLKAEPTIFVQSVNKGSSDAIVFGRTPPGSILPLSPAIELRRDMRHSAEQPSGPSRTLPPRALADPDGDMFDLEEDLEGNLVRPERIEYVDDELLDEEADGGLDGLSSLAGRVIHDELEGEPVSTAAVPGGSQVLYDPIAGLIPGSNENEIPPATVDESAAQFELRLGSATSSQQPTRPGFRRPSVHADPVFVGSLIEYAQAENRAVQDEVYGSKFIQDGGNVSSFRGGSIGESYMERNAAMLGRMRSGVSSDMNQDHASTR